MKLSSSLLVVAASLGLFACASGGTEDTGAGAGAVSTASTAIAAGDYGIDNASIGGTLTIEKVTADAITFRLGVLNKFGGQNEGDLDTSTAHATYDGYEFTNKDDCTIHLSRKDASTVTVKQTGACVDEGFGANVDGSGDYATAVAKANAGEAAQAGTYALLGDTSVRTGDLTVTAADTHSMTLSIEVQNLTGGMNEGALGPVVLGNLGHSTYSYGGNDDGCVINAKVSGDTIEITEFAVCQQLGANVHLAGTYKKK